MHLISFTLFETHRHLNNLSGFFFKSSLVFLQLLFQAFTNLNLPAMSTFPVSSLYFLTESKISGTCEISEVYKCSFFPCPPGCPFFFEVSDFTSVTDVDSSLETISKNLASSHCSQISFALLTNSRLHVLHLCSRFELVFVPLWV